MASKRPEFNDKIEAMHALAPIAFMSHVISPPIRVLAPFVYSAEVISNSNCLNVFDFSSFWYLIPSDKFPRLKLFAKIYLNNNNYFLVKSIKQPLNISCGKLDKISQPVNSRPNEPFGHSVHRKSEKSVPTQMMESVNLSQNKQINVKTLD